MSGAWWPPLKRSPDVLAHARVAGSPSPEANEELAEDLARRAALREAIKDTDLLDKAEVEHASAKDLIAQIQGAAEVDDMFDAKVTVLGEYIYHHVKEERNEIFVKARAAQKLDLIGMRDKLTARKEELLDEPATA
ncbi:hemerythrin domain-containing protein [Variovorax sp. W2I14]|uniref:hemerythrin domain-containing protein n=1 Tax=Variovorax sp. W2I14 TaxID=3042290 RepID=UPI003D23B9EB